MENVQVVELKEGCFASFDLMDVGFRIDGPAKIIVLKEETAADATGSNTTRKMFSSDL